MAVGIGSLVRLDEEIQNNPFIQDELNRRHGFREIKERLSEILIKCDGNEIDLFIELVGKYEIYKNYDEHIDILVDWVLQKFALEKHICICPPYTKMPGMQKSAGLVAYGMRSRLQNSILAESGCSIEVRDILPVDLKPSVTCIIVDDFCGSGQTILDAARVLMLGGHETSKIYAAVAYGMIDGLIALQVEGVACRAAVKKSKCLTGATFENPLIGTGGGAIYDALESKLDVKNVFRRGYLGSEALVSLMRTPDNTLPIFWSKGSDNQWPCPFPR